MQMINLFREIEYTFRIQLPGDFMLWDCTVNGVVNQINEAIDRVFVEIPSDHELRDRIFDEIASCLANALERDKEEFHLDQRFQDCVPWYRRGRVRRALTRTLDKDYSWLLQAEPGCGGTATCFFLAGLCGAVYIVYFEKQPGVLPLVTWVALACYIISILLLNGLFIQPFRRLPFNTISEAVDKIIDWIKQKDEYVWATYHGNQEVIHDRFLQMLASTAELARPEYKESKLKEDFHRAIQRHD